MKDSGLNTMPLRRLVAASNTTQTVLAAEIGVCPATLWAFLHGKSSWTGRKLILFADYFGVTTDYLLGREE